MPRAISDAEPAPLSVKHRAGKYPRPHRPYPALTAPKRSPWPRRFAGWAGSHRPGGAFAPLILHCRKA